MPGKDHTPLAHRLICAAPVPGWWTSREAQIQSFLGTDIKRGRTEVLAVSPGGRPVRTAAYGEPEPHLRGAVNFNSAVGGNRPEAFCRRSERQRPVLMVLAGVHGAEVEGMVGALSLLRIMEQGTDLTGAPQPGLAALLDGLRLIVIPLANPDGRARVPYDGFVGLPTGEMHKVNQGTRRDGTLYGWPGCKLVHPMQDDVGFLGGYFDDGGINLMHDEWWQPMSPVTGPLLKLVLCEAPDLVLNLHSHSNPPAVLEPAFVPASVKAQAAGFAQHYYDCLDREGIGHGPVPGTGQDGDKPFNLSSALYHAGAALPVTVEFPHGLADGRLPFDYPAILAALHALFTAAAEYLKRG